MSLILDALNKSDQARRRGKSSKVEAASVPPPVQSRGSAHRYCLLIAIALCLNAALLVWWLRPWESGTGAKSAPEQAAAVKATQDGPTTPTVPAPAESGRDGTVALGQASGESRDREDLNRVALAGSAGKDEEKKPATGAVGNEPETAATIADASGAPGESRKAVTAPGPVAGGNRSAIDKPAMAQSKPQEDIARADASSPETASTGPVPVHADAPQPARPVDTPESAARIAAAKVNKADPSGNTAGPASSNVPDQKTAGSATVEPTQPKTTPPPSRQVSAPQKAASVETEKMKEAEPLKAVKPKPAKAAKADDGVRTRAERSGYSKQIGGSRELVSDLRSLIGTGDQRKKAPSSGSVLKYYELPSSVRDSLPKLSMSMLLHSGKSEERWVNINGSKVREGQEIASGLKVVEITPDGAVFSYKGQKFYKAVIGD